MTICRSFWFWLQNNFNLFHWLNTETIVLLAQFAFPVVNKSVSLLKLK